MEVNEVIDDIVDDELQEVVEVADDQFEEYVEGIAANDLKDPKLNSEEIQDILPDIKKDRDHYQDLVQARINVNMDLQNGPHNHNYNLRTVISEIMHFCTTQLYLLVIWCQNTNTVLTQERY